MAVQNLYTNAGSAVAFLVLARLIAPSKFGLAALAQVVISLATMIADLGVTPSMMRASELSDETLNTGFWLGIAVSMALGAAVELLAPLIAAVFHQPQLGLILRVVAFTIPLTSLRSVPTVLLSRQLEMRPQAVREIIGVTIATLGGIGMAVAGFGVWSLVFQDFGTVLTDALILWMLISWRPRMRFAPREARGLLAFGYQVTLSQLISQSQDRVAQLLLGQLAGITALGYWVVASQIAQMTVTMFASTVDAIAVPAFAIVRHDPARLARAIRHSVRVCATIAIPGLGALAAVSPLLIPLLFGQRWHTAGGLAQIMCITAGFAAIQFLDGNIWWTLGKPRVNLVIVSVVAVVQIALVWILAGHGVIVVALALLGRTLVSGVARLVVLTKLGQVPIACYRDVPAIILCGAFMYGAMRAVTGALDGDSAVLVICVQVVIGATAYLGSGFVLQRTALLEFRHDLATIARRR